MWTRAYTRSTIYFWGCIRPERFGCEQGSSEYRRVFSFDPGLYGLISTHTAVLNKYLYFQNSEDHVLGGSARLERRGCESCSSEHMFTDLINT